MLLTLDVGNTNTVLGVFRGIDLVAHWRLTTARDQTIDEYGILTRDLFTLANLEPREIGELCRISSPSLAGVLSRMQELGYITRRRLDHDQRRVRVSLTPRSRGLAARMAPQIEATYRGIETVIGAEFSARFYRALDELIGALQ